MPRWLRNLALITGLTGWGATIASYLFHGQLPDALTLGIPAGLILALAPPIRKRKEEDSESGTVADESETDGCGTHG